MGAPGFDFGALAGAAGTGAAAGSIFGPAGTAVGALLGAGINVAMAVIGHFAAQGDEDTARKLYEQASHMYDSTQLPQFEQVVASHQDPTELSKIVSDPSLREAQTGSLGALKNISDSGGLTLTDQANLKKLENDTEGQARGARERVLSQLRSRGLGSSGLAVTSQNQANQAAAQRMSEAGATTAGNAQDRALQAILSRGTLAGSVRGQDWNEHTQVATAQDMINRYNADAIYRAQHDRNANTQTQFGNQMGLNNARYGVARDSAGNAGRDAQHTRDFWSGLGTAGSQAANAVAQIPGQTPPAPQDQGGMGPGPGHYNPATGQWEY